MKLKLLLISFLLLIAVNGINAQEEAQPLQVVSPTIGIGRLQISLNDSIPLYRTADDIRAFDTLTFAKFADGVNKGKFTMATTANLNIVPYSFHPGSSYDEAVANVKAGLAYVHPTLVFKVTKLVNGGFEIVLNERSFETCVIKKDKEHTLYTNGKPYWSLNHSSEVLAPAWFLYESWANYLKRLAAIKATNPKLYDSPGGKLVLSPRGELSFQVVHAIEQWLKIRLTGEQMKDGVRDEVWIRWTDGRNLLITPVEEIYY